MNLEKSFNKSILKKITSDKKDKFGKRRVLFQTGLPTSSADIPSSDSEEEDTTNLASLFLDKFSAQVVMTPCPAANEESTVTVEDDSITSKHSHKRSNLMVDNNFTPRRSMRILAKTGLNTPQSGKNDHINLQFYVLR